MKINIGIWDRAARLLIGVAMIVWGVAGGPWWAQLGLVPVATAAWRFDPFYAVFRVGTARTRLSSIAKPIPAPQSIR